MALVKTLKYKEELCEAGNTLFLRRLQSNPSLPFLPAFCHRRYYLMIQALFYLSVSFLFLCSFFCLEKLGIKAGNWEQTKTSGSTGSGSLDRSRKAGWKRGTFFLFYFSFPLVYPQKKRTWQIMKSFSLEDSVESETFDFTDLRSKFSWIPVRRCREKEKLARYVNHREGNGA